ncbi:hypothetical protein PQQ63_37415 [Paraburkholderia metrosideri]|uniref:Uncharacterized protein n=1 Tax=Paraburkholderia metrosideri TaxID=580937 RepID=A0ABW9E4P2_9BURK
MIASSLTMGLTYRMRMTRINSGLLEPIPPHPGRTVPFSLLEEWMAGDDYEPRDRLRITLDAVRLGVPVAAKDLRQVFDAAMAAPVGEEHSDGSVAGRALEVLYANGEAPPLHQLEFLAISATYNLASSAVALIAKGGRQAEAETLIRLYENVTSASLRSMILGVLEPLAGRLGLRITRSDNTLMAMAI